MFEQIFRIGKDREVTQNLKTHSEQKVLGSMGRPTFYNGFRGSICLLIDSALISVERSVEMHLSNFEFLVSRIYFWSITKIFDS